MFRFENSYKEAPLGNKLIDFCIAYEALFLKGEYKQSELGMGLVIGLACSMLLGKNKEERDHIKNVIQKGFNNRNDIIHGKITKNDEILNILDPFEDYLRKAILKLKFDCSEF